VLTRALVGTGCLLTAIEVAPKLEIVLKPGAIPLPFAGVPLAPPGAVPWLLALWGAGAVAFTLGRGGRAAGIFLLTVMTYVLVLDQRTYSNHLYLLCLLVLILVSTRDPHTKPLLRIQASIVYAYAALAKVNLSFLSGAVLLWQAHGVLPAGWLRLEVLAPLAWLIVLAEGFLAVAFWSPRLRGLGWAVGLGLHAGSVAFVRHGRLGVVIFGLAMVGLYAAFDAPKSSVARSRSAAAPRT
jgi:hypothetical protein